MSDSSNRCNWAETHPLHIAYHDTEWGVPVHDERLLFEMLNLEGQQAGVSWLVILQKRKRYQELFLNFEAEKVVQLSDDYLEAALLDKGIIRNRLKVFSIRKNAEAFLKVQAEFGSFDHYLWDWVDGKPIQHAFKTKEEIPASTPLSERLAKDLKKRGFKFVGSTIIYAFMQGIGMVNDHTTDCFRYEVVREMGK